MKKILTFFMAVVVAMSMYALPQKGLSAKDAKASFEKAKVENPLKAKVEKKHSEKLLVRDFVPAQVKEEKALAPVKKAAAKNSVAANERDTVKLSFEEFQVGPDYYEDYEEWYVAVGNGSYGFRFDWYSADFEGTFTIDDMELEYSYGWYLNDWDEEVYVEYVEVEMTTSTKAVDEYTDLLTLDATILGDDDKVYVISATHKILKPKEIIEIAIEEGAMTWDVDWELATLDAKNDDMEIYMEWICYWVTNPVSIYDVMDYTVKYKGEALELINMDMTVNAVKNDEGVIGYEIYMEMLSNEPIQYNVTVFAPIVSTETVEIEINNLSIDASAAYDWGWIFCDGENDEWELSAGIDAYVMGFEMAEGTYKSVDEVMFYLTNKVTGDFTEQLYAEVVVTNDPEYGWVLNFESLCTDNKTYKVTMKKEVPAATDTVAIRFEKSANAAYYPWLDNDLLLANSNEQFYAGIDVVGVEMGGEFTMEDLDLSYSLIFSDYANRVMVEMADVKGTIYQVGDTTYIKAEVIGYDGVLYDVELWHCVPTPTETVQVEIVADFENNINTDGYYVLSGYSNNTLYVSLAPFAEEVAGTFVNDGVFSRFGEGQYDFYCDYSAIYKNVNGEVVPYSVEKCTMTVTEEEDGLIKAVATLIAADAVQYEVTMTTTYNNHLNYDAVEGAIDRTFTADDVLLMEQHDNGISYLEVTDADGSDMFALYFFSEEYDSEIVIQPGTYTIDDTQDYMTVLASAGVVGTSIYPSFYGYLSEDGKGIITPLYFLVGGTVEVENRNGNLYVEVNAVNSYGVPVHIVYDATPVTPVEPVEMVGVVKRTLFNGYDVVVLTHEEDGTAHIYNIVEGDVLEVSQEGVIAVDPENAGDYLAISDIALTEDGKLVATNYMQTQSGDDYVDAGYKRGETRIYMWDDLAGAPSILFTSKMSSNWFRSKQGLTMAVKGTSDNMEIFMTGIHATKAWARASSYRVIDGVYTEPEVNHNDHYFFYDINDAIALETTVGEQYELNVSPLGEMNWVLDAEKINPTEIVESATNNVEIATSVALTEDLGKKYNGASYITVGEAVYMVAPFANPDGELVGIEILNITNGFDAPQYVDMLYLDEAVSAQAAATAVTIVENTLAIALVVDAQYYMFDYELVVPGGEYEVYEDEITNLVIDLDNLVLIGGPSTAFQVDVYLPLGEYNMSEDSYQLTAESSIAVMGSDATFIEGYAYEIDAFTPSAKAVVRCEWNGMKLEFHLTMSAAPMEATVVVVEDAVVEIEKYLLWGDMYDYALKMTGAWVNPEDGLTYPVLVEVPVYYPEATEPSEIMSTVTVGGWNDDDPWLGFGEGTLTVTTVDGVVTATGIVQNPMAGIAIDITISGKLPKEPTAIEDVEVEVKAVKVIKNGQLFINRDGKMYNAQGAIVK